MKALEEGNGKANLINGFRKCGIVPCNVNELLTSLPKDPSCKEDNVAAMDQSLINILTEMRQDGPKRSSKKSKKVQMVAGKSLSEEDLIDQPTISTPKKVTPKKLSGFKRKNDKASSMGGKKMHVDKNCQIEASSAIENEAEIAENVSAEESRISIGCYVKVIQGEYKGIVWYCC